MAELIDEGTQDNISQPTLMIIDSIEDSEVDAEEALDKVISLSLAALPVSLPRRKYKPKVRYTGDKPHANTVSTMPDYERRKVQEQSELQSGRYNLRRVDAVSMIF
jgi:hypothetical protein